MFRQIEIKSLKNQAGFTLIEMLVVVIILGILAMIIVP
ncbi:MAG: prepilin-type N-terminal cleavage/methylation domain-containing protein, partial [Desulfobacteria bacterium]